MPTSPLPPHKMTTPDLPDLTEMDPAERLFKHSVHPEWGVGLWVKERPKRRHIRFEDVGVRKFRKGFYHLLDPVDPSNHDVERLYERMAGAHELAAKREQEREAKEARPPVMTFDQQLAVFAELYPDGFQGAAWLEAHRRPVDGGSGKKAQVDSVIVAAKSELAEKKLALQLKQGEHDAIHHAATEILGKTSLVSVRNVVRPLRGLDADARKRFAEGLNALLHGPKLGRLNRWVNCLKSLEGPKVAWPLVTVYSALMEPNKHVCVQRTTTLKLQMRSLRPGSVFMKSPNRQCYTLARSTVRSVHRRLEEAGHKPADLLDAAMFIHETLRPKGRETLDDLS